jgi:GNAT superfamily N-acetyltransferase
LTSDLAPLLENEASFDELFCDVFMGNQFSVYYNTHFSEDPIFNHVFFSEWILRSENYNAAEVRTTLDEIVRKTRELDIPASLYVERAWKNARLLEQDAIEADFMIVELMHGLQKKPAPVPEDPSSDISSLITKDTDQWIRAFVKSFDIPDAWLPELKRRVGRTVANPDTVLLLAKERGIVEASGCLLMQIRPPGTSGVYCVGTIPERRSRGVARSLMSVAETVAAGRGCKIMVLQTLASDGVTPMYLKMGFETAFERDVLQYR